MNEVTKQAHKYATILMENMHTHSLQLPEDIADFSLRLATSIDRGLTNKELKQAAANQAPDNEGLTGDTPDLQAEIDEAIERYAPDWTTAPKWASWYSVNKNGLGVWHSYEPVSTEYGHWQALPKAGVKTAGYYTNPSTNLWEHLIYSRPVMPQTNTRPITGLHGPECTCTEEDLEAYSNLLKSIFLKD